MARDEILARLRERIVAFAASRIARDVAEDLAQEVLIVIEEKYAELDRIEDLVPVSMQVLRFKMAGLRRKVHRRGEAGNVSVDDVPLPDPGASPETHARREEMLRRLTAAMEKLPPRC